MRVLREWGTGLGILAGTVGGVAVMTMALTALMIPASATAVATPTPVPTFDLDTAPTAIGGSLRVTGDRTGTMALDEAVGTGPRVQAREEGGFSSRPAADVELRGPDARVQFDRNDGSVTQIGFEDMAFYLDPGECTVTMGAAHPQNGLMTAMVECTDIADIRDKGVVSIAGIVALPVEVLRGRAGIPESGGEVTLTPESVGPGEPQVTMVTLEEAELFLDVPPGEDGRITSGGFTEAGGFAVEYDPEAEIFYLTQVSAGDLYAVATDPCPVTTGELGRISDTVRVVRMEFDCADWRDVEGDPVAVSGSIVADIIEGLMEVEP